MRVLGRSRYRLIDSEGRKKKNRIRRVPSFTCYRFQISKLTFAFDGDTKTFGCRHQNFDFSSKQKFTEIQKFINIGNKTVFRRRKKLLRTSFLLILRVIDLKKQNPINFYKILTLKDFPFQNCYHLKNHEKYFDFIKISSPNTKN